MYHKNSGAADTVREILSVVAHYSVGCIIPDKLQFFRGNIDSPQSECTISVV